MADGSASWRSEALGPVQVLDLPGGRVRAHVTGDGPVIVFVHGALVNANLWRKVVPRLEGHKRVTLDLPLGSHLDPVPRGAALDPDMLTHLIADALEALDLDRVTMVGNDTGGGLTQLVAVRRPERIGAFVLTSSDAFENFPPRLFRVLFAPARIPGAIRVLMSPLRWPAARRLPIAYGWLALRPIEREAEDSYVLPVLERGEIRRDLRRLLGSADPSYTLDAAAKLTGFDKPVLIAWSADDHFFPPAHAERLAKLIPDARLEWIDDSLTFSPEDRPDRLAELIAGFVAERTGEPASR